MKYFIKTFGCQMNENNSERIAAFLENKGYEPVKGADSSAEVPLSGTKADLIIVNACSVRQSAVDRIFGLKQKFARLKAKKILTGCILKSDKKKFEKFFDEVLNIKEFLGENYLSLKPLYSSSFSAFVPIMTGCNNFCSYCVVPHTRGREVSRPAKEIIKEIKILIKQGHKEIILLGQNVNSYKSETQNAKRKTRNAKRTVRKAKLSQAYQNSKLIKFPELLKKINAIPGDFQIKFLTSHPKDFSDKLIDAIAKCEKVAKEIHLPVQSGDDKILKKMNRGYTVGQYKNLVNRIREKIPQVKISTDVIVGFPKETKKQFENTVKLFKQIKFDKAYINKYSTRAGTVAAKWKDSVPWKEKKRRWKVLNDILSWAEKKEKLIVVLGPTASGKSDLAVKLALQLRSGQAKGAEIVSADSRQVYKGMNIGTGKITKKEMKNIPHHLLDIASPRSQFTVAQYKKKALKVIDEIYRKNKIPILCGGTGFYIQAVVEGLKIPKVKPDQGLRKELEKKTTERLFKKLKKLDPRRAKGIDPKNKRRLIRALEIVIKTGKPVPVIEMKPRFNVLYLGIKRPKQELKILIKKRLLCRIKKGMITEVKRLRKSGLSWKRLDDFGLEYRWVAKYLQGKITKEEMIEMIQKESEHYAKRQMTWFKKNKKINWIENYSEAEKTLKKFLSFCSN